MDLPYGRPLGWGVSHLTNWWSFYVKVLAKVTRKNCPFFLTTKSQRLTLELWVDVFGWFFVDRLEPCRFSVYIWFGVLCESNCWVSFVKHQHLAPETSIYKRWFQLDDFESLHEKWLFHQTSILNGCLEFQAWLLPYIWNRLNKVSSDWTLVKSTQENCATNMSCQGIS